MSATFAFPNVCALDSWARAAGLSTDEDARIKRIAAKCKEVGADVIGVKQDAASATDGMWVSVCNV